MEQKLVKVPFEVKLAKKITEKYVDGRIVTRDGRKARIVCWDKKSDSIYNIVALLDVNTGELIFTYTVNGFEVVDRESDNDLMLEVPEYMTFKDGDVIAYDNVKDVFFIIGSKCSMTDENPHYHVRYENGSIAFGTENSFCRLKGSRLATEEERQKIFESLNFSSDFRAKECLERFFPNHSNSPKIRKECEFNPFDKVLVRDNGGFWICSLFSHISKKQDKYKYITVTGSFENCIPYNEQTARLLGTTNEWEEK